MTAYYFTSIYWPMLVDITLITLKLKVMFAVARSKLKQVIEARCLLKLTLTNAIVHSSTRKTMVLTLVP